MVREEPWLSRLTNLYFDGFMLDRPAAFLLSNLPNLVRLSLTVTDCYVETEAVECVELLLSGSKLEQLLVQRFPLEMRALFSNASACAFPQYLIRPSRWRRTGALPIANRNQRVWHGLPRNRVSLARFGQARTSSDHGRRALPAMLRDRGPGANGKALDHARLLYAEPAHTTAGGPCPDKTTRYDLCKRHDDEIFGSDLVARMLTTGKTCWDVGLSSACDGSGWGRKGRG